MAINDEVLDSLVGRSVDLARFELGEIKRINRFLAQLQKELIQKLEKISPTGVRRTVYQQKRLQILLAEVNTTISSTFGIVWKQHRESMVGLAELEQRAVVGTLNGMIKADITTPSLVPSKLKALVRNTLIQGAPSKEWWSKQSVGLQDAFAREIRMGVAQGEPLSDLTRRIRGTRENKFKDGIMRTSTRNAHALIRTSVQTVANGVREELYQANDDIVKGIEWVATLDARTSQICRTLDGLTWDTAKKPQQHSHPYPGPTAHWNCRSTQVPVLRSWEELGAKGKFKKIPRSTRASMDGQVASKLSYEQWLKRKPEAFQREILGKKKQKMWKEGKLAFTDLVDFRGRELNLEQLATAVARRDSLPVESQSVIAALQARSEADRKGLYKELAAASGLTWEAVQQLNRQWKGNPSGDTANEIRDSVNRVFDLGLPLKAESIPVGYKPLVRAMYKRTQSSLKELGVEELILYRGGHMNKTALHSFSSDYDLAEKRFKKEGTLFYGRVPRKYILSTPRTGISDVSDKEFLVLGSFNDVESIGD